MDALNRPPQFSLIGALVSLLIPGLGQVVQREYKRGIYIFLAVATAAATTFWYGKLGWVFVLALLWLWNVWDAAFIPRRAPIWAAAVLWMVLAYGIGWQITEIQPMAFIQNTRRAESLLRPFLRPDFVEQRAETRRGWGGIEVPCSANPPASTHTENGITVTVEPACAALNEYVTVTAEGLWPSEQVTLRWETPNGQFPFQIPLESDADGRVTHMFVVNPTVLAAAPDVTLPLPHRVQIIQRRTIDGYIISKNGNFIIQGIYETLALALLSTLIGAILAIPLGFLAARNLMGGNPVTMSIYVIVRTILNVIRSIESLILAIIFVVIVGLGPFPGMLALTLHTIAALGKLYSEVIEGIDSGPIEALQSTGANWLQVVSYAVIPQIVPPFTALTIYRWDINVRSSTIIGFVGGGGIGFFLYQWILIQDFRAVSASFIAIALVVIILDFFSARLRERLA